jgi:1-phosphofructokinase family hexose kinase
VIYTVTLNPAIDRILEIDTFQLDGVNRIEGESRYAGGKGIDVSRALRELGSDSVALGFVGGYTGHEVAGRLGAEMVNCRFTLIDNETRTNIIVHCRSSGKVTSLNARGPDISSVELESFLKHLGHLYPPPSFFVCSGSVPPGVPSDIYRRLIEWARSHQIKVLLDATGLPFKEGIEATPFAIKPNRRELSDLVGRELNTIEDVVACAEKLHIQGISVVLVSLGAEGIVGLSDEGAFHALPPKVEVNSTVGAGDSAVAGFLIGQLGGFGLAEALRLAAAAGTAAALTSGTELCRREDFERLREQISVRKHAEHTS